ncbi:hypothetical protein Syun_020694 [Stephania yunnanensis]|uniref:Uncharacterized protein n=1 Tax=Stephania yunnanensis TaxID=152371 RepID=A0AAP0IG77_9MAGN
MVASEAVVRRTGESDERDAVGDLTSKVREMRQRRGRAEARDGADRGRRRGRKVRGAGVAEAAGTAEARAWAVARSSRAAKQRRGRRRSGGGGGGGGEMEEMGGVEGGGERQDEVPIEEFAFIEEPEKECFNEEEFLSEKEDVIILLYGYGEVDLIFFKEDFDNFDEAPIKVVDGVVNNYPVKNIVKTKVKFTTTKHFNSLTDDTYDELVTEVLEDSHCGVFADNMDLLVEVLNIIHQKHVPTSGDYYIQIVFKQELSVFEYFNTQHRKSHERTKICK